MFKIKKIPKKIKKNKKYVKLKIKNIKLYFFFHYEKDNNIIMGLSEKETNEIYINLYLFFLKNEELIFTTILHELIHIFYPKLKEEEVEEKTQNYKNYITNYKFNFVYQIAQYIHNEIVLKYEKKLKFNDFKKIIDFIDKTEYIIVL